MSPDRFGYARVSTLEQDPALQLDALKEAGCVQVWTDFVTGTRADRPELAKALAHLRKDDTLIVWRLDRLGRSLHDLVALAKQLAVREIALSSLREQIDTSTPGGKLVFHMFGALAEFEVDLIRERTAAGLAAARARGRVGGRRPSLNVKQIGVARTMRSSREYTMQQIADHLGVSRSTIYRVLAE